MGRVRRIISVLSRWRHRRLLVAALDLGTIAGSTVLAFLLRFDFTIPQAELAHLRIALLGWAGAKLAAFLWMGAHRGALRYVSIQDVATLAGANLLGSAAGIAVILWLGSKGFPRSVYVLDLLVCILLTAGWRIAARLAGSRLGVGRRAEGRRALIYGAGEAGVAILREVRQNPGLRYTVVGFVDDNREKKGLVIHGLKVLGTGAALPSLAARHRVETVLIAIPSATGAQMTRILERCHAARLPCKTVPGLAEVIETDGLARQIRDVAVDDLLSRAPVRLDAERIRNRFFRRPVLVTGAAGSIGSEICRQLARFHPSAIVGLDVAETGLFDLEREMRRSFPGVWFVPEIGSTRDRGRLDDVLRRRRPSVVYHAAAYKHVPMMETHVFEAVENNVFGTYNLAIAARELGVEDFVMISSDKAVRPASVMGATKRLAELVILALQDGGTKFSSVRFGNVLGSNGSVVPIFKQQIAAGGPVTVTHPAMRRYFMTIAEAAQLVLQASVMGTGGEIFVLDMGEPVRILDLARKLILLSGLRPDEEIKIQFTGVRPGEKLYEELSTLEENTLPTFHDKIKIFAGNGRLNGDLRAYLDALREICAGRDVPALLLVMKELIPEYNPSAQVLRRALARPGEQLAMRLAHVAGS